MDECTLPSSFFRCHLKGLRWGCERVSCLRSEYYNHPKKCKKDFLMRQKKLLAILKYMTRMNLKERQHLLLPIGHEEYMKK